MLRLGGVASNTYLVAFPAIKEHFQRQGLDLDWVLYSTWDALVDAFVSKEIDLSRLAECPNVTVKLGGLKMPICGFGWHKQPRPPSSAELAKTLGPYYLHCIEAFGPDRCMFESNFPVDKASCSYTVLWNCFKLLSKDFGGKERAALFYDTAVRVYRLEEE